MMSSAYIVYVVLLIICLLNVAGDIVLIFLVEACTLQTRTVFYWLFAAAEVRLYWSGHRQQRTRNHSCIIKLHCHSSVAVR